MGKFIEIISKALLVPLIKDGAVWLYNLISEKIKRKKEKKSVNAKVEENKNANDKKSVKDTFNKLP